MKNNQSNNQIKFHFAFIYAKCFFFSFFSTQFRNVFPTEGEGGKNVPFSLGCWFLLIIVRIFFWTFNFLWLKSLLPFYLLSIECHNHSFIHSLNCLFPTKFIPLESLKFCLFLYFSFHFKDKLLNTIGNVMNFLLFFFFFWTAVFFLFAKSFVQIVKVVNFSLKTFLGGKINICKFLFVKFDLCRLNNEILHPSTFWKSSIQVVHHTTPPTSWNNYSAELEIRTATRFHKTIWDNLGLLQR